jgi:hypothetical protein
MIIVGTIFYNVFLFISMRWSDELVKKLTTFSVLELKRTAVEIMEQSHNVCVRFRLLGQLWQSGFCRVISVTDNRILVNDESKNQLVSIDLNHMVQFEIDHKFKDIEPHFHYEVKPN